MNIQWFNLLVQKFRKLIYWFWFPISISINWTIVCLFMIMIYLTFGEMKKVEYTVIFCHPLLAVLSILSPGCGKTARPPRLTRRTCVIKTLVVLRLPFLQGPSRSSSCLFRSFSRSSSGLFRSFSRSSSSCLFRSFSGLFRLLSRSSSSGQVWFERTCLPALYHTTEYRVSPFCVRGLVTCEYW